MLFELRRLLSTVRSDILSSERGQTTLHLFLLINMSTLLHVARPTAAVRRKFIRLLSWPQRSPSPARRTGLVLKPAKRLAIGCHSSQSERLFLARIATGRPSPSAGPLTFYTSSLIVYLASGRCRPHTKLLAYCVPNTPVFCGAVHHVVRFEQLAKSHAPTP